MLDGLQYCSTVKLTCNGLLHSAVIRSLIIVTLGQIWQFLIKLVLNVSTFTLWPALGKQPQSSDNPWNICACVGSAERS